MSKKVRTSWIVRTFTQEMDVFPQEVPFLSNSSTGNAILPFPMEKFPMEKKAAEQNKRRTTIRLKLVKIALAILTEGSI